MNQAEESPYDLVIAGGGAAGFFAAIACAEVYPGARVCILEKGRRVLSKVKISGGGRCNVTHACYDPKELVEYYPRGSKQLRGPFYHWAPADTMEWFEAHGVALKVESDNRVFPQSDDSQTIIDCLINTARRAKVEILTNTEILDAVGIPNRGFSLQISGGTSINTRNLVLSLGGIRNRIGAELATSLGHTVSDAAPSLFTFKIKDHRLDGLQGIAVPKAHVQVGKGLAANGPVLITHWGLSGPAILRVSAWGARELKEKDYRFSVRINWCGDLSTEDALKQFQRLRKESPRRSILQDNQFNVPGRLWQRLAETAGIRSEQKWPHLEKSVAEEFARQLCQCQFRVLGKSMNKEEFVTCGGVNLDEINFKTMESRTTNGLYVVGELLDIDGITGGFNFQAAWTTGHLAGTAIGKSLEID